jgi:hypothetical protein
MVTNHPFDENTPITSITGEYPVIDSPTPPPTAQTITQTQPVPRVGRTLARWLLFAVNAIPFIVVVILMERGLLCANGCSNDIRLGISLWALVVLVHLFITALLDVLEGYVYSRQLQRARRHAEIQKKRARMLEQLYNNSGQ